MTKKKVETTNNYTAKDILVLEGLEPVRKRPAMYIGSTGPAGLHHLIWEVFDNSYDEALAGYAKNIEVTLLPDHQVRVKDDGRGIPVEKHKQTGKSALETVMTMLHAGGKFGGDSYKISGGLHGVGVSVVNALSVYLKAEVCRDGERYEQEYERGKPKRAVKKIGKCRNVGTTITFQPDPSVFETLDFDWNTIITHLRQQAYLIQGIKISIRDERNPVKFSVKDTKELVGIPAHTFYFDGGVVSYIKHFLNHDEEVKHPNIFYISKEYEKIQVEIGFQYTDDIQGNEMSFANNIHTVEGGMHLTGFRAAITRTLNDYARKSGLLKEKDENLTGDDIREGLTAVISVKLREPQFEGQTKAKLGNPEARTAVESVLNTEIPDWLERNPSDARAILEKVLLASKARIAAKAARETVIRKGALEGLALPGKLADCSSRDASESELFIVEGASAGGSAKSGRNRHFQAILPLRGKILNVERARIDKMLASEEIRTLVIALGTAIAEEFDLAKLRYHKVIIMTDADVDGAHIRTLLLTLFFRYFPQLIESGHIFIARPPLYRLQKRNEVEYVYNDEAKDKLLKRWAAETGAKTAGRGGTKNKSSVKSGEWEVSVVGETASKAGTSAEDAVSSGDGREQAENAAVKGIDIQRYKGLGEMNADQLWETTLNPENRILFRVTVKDVEEANRVFDTLMGSEVFPRKKFIQTHAKNVKNLDV